MTLQELNFEFVHIKGKRNMIADGLSWTIFPGEQLEISEDFRRIIKLKEEDSDKEWFWKDGKGSYEEFMRERLKNEEDKEESVSMRMRVVMMELNLQKGLGCKQSTCFPMLNFSFPTEKMSQSPMSSLSLCIKEIFEFPLSHHVNGNPLD